MNNIDNVNDLRNENQLLMQINTLRNENQLLTQINNLRNENQLLMQLTRLQTRLLNTNTNTNTDTLLSPPHSQEYSGTPSNNNIPTPSNNNIPMPSNNNIPTPSNNNIPTPSNNNNIRQPSIQNILHQLFTQTGIGHNLPFEIEISTIPNDILNNINIPNNNISLANINKISTILKYEDYNNDNNNNNNNNNNSASDNDNNDNNSKSDNDSESDNDLCTICQQIIIDNDIIRILNHCKHLFHLQCVDIWLSNNNTCPSCRHNISEIIPPSTRNLNNLSNNNIHIPIYTPSRPARIPTQPTHPTIPISIPIPIPIQEPQPTIPIPIPIPIQEPQQPNVRVFTGSFQGINNLHNDINNLVSTSVPLINTMFSSNTEPILNTSNIQSNVNSLFNSINANQMFQLFNNLAQTRNT